MNQHTNNYSQQLAAELKQVPEEYMPALINMIHGFRQGVIQKHFENELQESLRQAKSSNTFPVDDLWNETDY